MQLTQECEQLEYSMPPLLCLLCAVVVFGGIDRRDMSRWRRIKSEEIIEQCKGSGGNVRGERDRVIRSD